VYSERKFKNVKNTFSSKIKELFESMEQMCFTI